MPVKFSECNFLFGITLTFAYVSKYVWFYDSQWRRCMEVVLADSCNPLNLLRFGSKDGREAPKDAHVYTVVKQ